MEIIPEDNRNSTTSKEAQERLYGLDHLRALAIIMVFVFHYYLLNDDHDNNLYRFGTFGWTGVDLFFVLSGFLITAPLFRAANNGRKITYSDFFIRRSFRIFPLYFFTLAVYFLIPQVRELESLPPLWKFLTFTQNLGLDAANNGTFSHAWSLCVEEHFYFFTPLIFIFLQKTGLAKKSFWLIIALFIAGFLIRYYSYKYLYLPVSAHDKYLSDWYKYVYYPSYNRLDSLLAGVAIALVYSFYPRLWSRLSEKGNFFLLSGIALLTVSFFLFRDKTSTETVLIGFPLIAAAYSMIVIGSLSPKTIFFKIRSETTYFIAAISFPLYLTHKWIIHITGELLPKYHISGYPAIFIAFAGSVALAALLMYLIERPFMLLRNRILSKRS